MSNGCPLQLGVYFWFVLIGCQLMNYVNTSCLWPLSAEFKTVFTTAPVFFFYLRSFYMEKSWKLCCWYHLVWICSCSVGNYFSTLQETLALPALSLFCLSPFCSSMLAVGHLFVSWHLCSLCPSPSWSDPRERLRWHLSFSAAMCWYLHWADY